MNTDFFSPPVCLECTRPSSTKRSRLDWDLDDRQSFKSFTDNRTIDHLRIVEKKSVNT